MAGVVSYCASAGSFGRSRKTLPFLRQAMADSLVVRWIPSRLFQRATAASSTPARTASPEGARLSNLGLQSRDADADGGCGRGRTPYVSSVTAQARVSLYPSRSTDDWHLRLDGRRGIDLRVFPDARGPGASRSGHRRRKHHRSYRLGRSRRPPPVPLAGIPRDLSSRSLAAAFQHYGLCLVRRVPRRV